MYRKCYYLILIAEDLYQRKPIDATLSSILEQFKADKMASKMATLIFTMKTKNILCQNSLYFSLTVTAHT